ncbi:MAG: DNA internalization-related competence protein ComEC/Rec2 [Eubacterium sp.]
MKWNAAWVYAVVPIIVLIGLAVRGTNKKQLETIITKKQAEIFVMIFLSAFSGYLVTLNAVHQRDRIYSMKEVTVEVQGTVSKLKESSYGWIIYLEKAKIAKKENNLKETVDQKSLSEQSSDNNYSLILVSIRKKPRIKIGNVIAVQGKLKQFDVAHNPGNFDSRKYYMSLGIYGKVEAEKFVVVSRTFDGVRENLYRFRLAVRNKLQNICGDKYDGVWKVCNEKAGIFSSILLGDKTELNSDIKSLYSMSGISHILAISGLHISFIGMLVYSLLRKRFRFGFSASASIVIVVGFGIMSGMGIATIRAMVMFGLRLLGEVLGRTYDNLTAVSTAGIILMMWNPFVIFNSGFQMSFGAIIAIVLIFPVIQNILQLEPVILRGMVVNKKNIYEEDRRLLKIRAVKNKALNAVLFSFNVSLVMNPIIAYHYFQLPTYSFLLNTIVVHLMSIVIISGLLGSIVSFIHILAGQLCILPGCAVLELYSRLCLLINKLPFSNIIVGEPSLETIFVYYVILGLFLLIANTIRNHSVLKQKQQDRKIEKNGKIIESKLVIGKRKKKLNRKFIFAMICLIFVLNTIIYMPGDSLHSLIFTSKDLQITFLDVGQGDGIFMRTNNGVTITVDGGSTSVDDVGQYRIIPFLKSQAIRKIDYAIMTHADYDHISGLIEMMKESDNNGVKVKNLVLPEIRLKDEPYYQMIQTAHEHGVGVLYITRGDCMRIGNVELKCIYPSVWTAAEDRNDYSTVLGVKYGQFSMLLTGDISTEPEQGLQEMLDDHYTILKVAHHGSKYSTSSEFLQWINPDYSVISVGEHNMYGHPGSETLKRLEQIETQILRTDESGGIAVYTDGEGISINPFIK